MSGLKIVHYRFRAFYILLCKPPTTPPPLPPPMTVERKQIVRSYLNPYYMLCNGKNNVW